MIYVKRNASLIPKKLLDEAAAAQIVLDGLPPAQRKFYIKRKSALWRAFGKYLAQMSCGKCWYSESADPQSFFDVDHFRPKSEARRSKTELDVPGYEWLAFSWDNFRYSATRSNRVSKNEKGKVEGKGSWFPLLDQVKASWANRCEQTEKPLLLDPVNKSDLRLIDVAADGLIVPSKFAVGTAKERVIRSCELYGLNLAGIKEARLQLIRDINDLVGTLEDCVTAANSPVMPLEAADLIPIPKQLDALARKTCPKSPYARTARATLIRAGLGALCVISEEAEDIAAA